ncbi:hypothetical protein [Streptomyces lavendofoliae]|uniref:hypothetical protein n=1 Tax=Streptomyces lavendofoliae TaxID=67314 RepID=UPI00300E7FDC
MTTYPGTPVISRIVRVIALSAVTCAALAGMTVSASADDAPPTSVGMQQLTATSCSGPIENVNLATSPGLLGLLPPIKLEVDASQLLPVVC